MKASELRELTVDELNSKHQKILSHQEFGRQSQNMRQDNVTKFKFMCWLIRNSMDKKLSIFIYYLSIQYP